MRLFVIALAMFACALALPVPQPRELMQLEKAPAAPDAANQYVPLLPNRTACL
jgi:hypothetical protein